MASLTFHMLNMDWNAEPNDPDERIEIHGSQVVLSFVLNPWAYVAKEGQRGRLIFSAAQRWRLGPTNDEGWYRGQCRYGQQAPKWGEFYEILGPDDKLLAPSDWQEIRSEDAGSRHFLFYLRDDTFECVAGDWSFERCST